MTIGTKTIPKNSTGVRVFENLCMKALAIINNYVGGIELKILISILTYV